MGATGLESDVWVTADGVAVLQHDERVRIGLRRRRIPGLARAALPAALPALEDLYATCGTDFELSLDVKDPAAAPVAMAVARGAGALGRLWLCHPDVDLLAGWRAASDDVKLVNSAKLRRLPRGPERRAAELDRTGIDAVNLHCTEWTGGHVALFHRFGRLAFAWDAQHERVISELLAMGIDGIYGDHVNRLLNVLSGPGETPAREG